MQQLIHRAIGTVALLAIALLAAGCAAAPQEEPQASAQTIRVPGDAETVQEGVDLLRPGDMLLIGPGVYHEELVVQTPDVTIRGEDRNAVVLDGEGELAQGILVIADGVRVQNLTVHSYLYNGVLVTGMHDGAEASAHGIGGYDRLDPEEYPPLQRYAIEYVTAYNNGLYGLYAFNAQHGVIADSYASGSADSGIYVGQCEECDVLVTGNVAEGNAIGFENANASGPLSIVGNRFAHNRVGMTVISNYQEAYSPQSGNVIAGNVIADNTNPESPAQADGGFGIGVGVAGGQDNVIQSNRISGNSAAGIALSNTEDIPATDNRIGGGVFENNAVDVIDVSSASAPAVGNCVASGATSVLPETLRASACSGEASVSSTLTPIAAPPGVSFLRIPVPIDQPQLADTSTIPDALPRTVNHPDVVDILVPDAGLLRDRSRL